MANVYARLGNGDAALECLDLLARSCIGPNLFSHHNDYRKMGITLDNCDGLRGGVPPFQIDANMGWTAAIYEMMLCSFPGEIKILPALPQRWKKGKVSNLGACWQIAVDITWNMNDAKLEFSLISQLNQVVKVTLPEIAANEVVIVTDNRSEKLSNKIIELHLQPYKPVKCTARMKTK